MRDILDILKEDPYKGPIDSPHISYSSESKGGEITKVIAQLESHASGRYTKLGRNLKRIERLESGVKKMKEQVKADTKELIADLFHAENAAHTRVVDTVSFIFELTKDPKATETFQYSKILEALEKHLTPELIVVLEQLKGEFSSTTQKSPALKSRDKKPATESLMLGEGIWDTIKASVRKFMDKFTVWGKAYDAKLNKLKSMAQTSESMDEAAPTPTGGSAGVTSVMHKWASKLTNAQFTDGILFDPETMHIIDSLRSLSIIYNDKAGQPLSKAFDDPAAAQEFAFLIVSRGGSIDSVDATWN